MPGKVNPVIPEVVLQVSAQVIGNDTAITIGGMQGQFELNVRVPLIARNLLQSIHLLSTASVAFAEKCIDGITANEKGAAASAAGTLATATALNEAIGYDLATKIVKEATASGEPLRDVALANGVDADLYETSPDNADLFLTSVLKGMSTGVQTVVEGYRVGEYNERPLKGLADWSTLQAGQSQQALGAQCLLMQAVTGFADADIASASMGIVVWVFQDGHFADLLGVARLERATPDQVRDSTGFAIGGVAPVGPPEPVLTLVDVDLARYDVVWAAAGHPHVVFPTSYSELVRMTGGQAAEVA